MGEILGIAQREKTKAPMEEIHEAAVTFDNGVGTDSRGKKRNHRQVTLLSKESWDDACQEMGKDLTWTIRRANILISGIDLKNATGKLLQIGDAIVKITGELEPCNRMDEQVMGLREVLEKDWRGGATSELIQEGHIQEGDSVAFIDSI